MFSRCVLTLLIMGLCQMAATASPSLRKFPGTASVGNVKPAPAKKMVRSRANAQSDNGLSGYMMCNNIDEDTYNQYNGVYLGQYHSWFWATPASKSFEADRTVLTYNTSEGYPYFYFRVEEGGAPLEAIKLILDKSRINDASIECLFYDFNSEEGGFDYTDTNVTTDYENGFVYWKPESAYSFDNIFFYVTSGELNIIGFEIYTEGYTPDDFFSAGSPVDKVAAPIFKPEVREFTDPISVEISAAEGCTIYYTTDGSAPQVDDKCKYNGPVVISATTTFLAFAVDGEGNRSRTVEAKYICTRHGIGEDYNPESPGNPGEEGGTVEKTYHLSVVTNPTGAGYVDRNDGEYKAGARVYLYTYPNTGFVFQNWTIDGTVVSTESYFNYVMPDHDVAVIANFVFDPASPGNPSPDDQRVSHPVVVRAIPSGAASMSPSGTFAMEENTTRQVYAYPKTGWKLTGWTVNGEQQPGSPSYLDITMGERALDVAAYFTFDPGSPSNPAANYFNPSTGQMIVDDFTPGNLYQAMRDLVGDDGYSTISSLIVKGRMAENDYGVAGMLGNASVIDFSRTAGNPEIPPYAFEMSKVSNILLPADITSIGYGAFYGCENLSSLTVYAQVPPDGAYEAFYGFTNKANCTLYVPASALELYSNAEGWKDFLILPITDDAHVLQVNLPADASDGRYKNNTIEVVNINSGLRQKYVITDRMIYTFNGLQKDEQYNIYMFSQAGLEIGRIENVMIPDGDIEVTFDNLKTLHTVYAKVLDGEGRDVTTQVTVEWYKPLADETLTYLRKAVLLGEVPEGQQLLCRVGLDNNLGVVYSTPADVTFTVGASDNVCTVRLEPFRSVELTGTVVDGDGAAISGASVSATQTLGGKFTKTFTAKTDRNGLWKLSVLDAPETRITYAATDFVNFNDTIGSFDVGVTSIDLGHKALKSIIGARVSYGFTYREAGSEEVEDFYSDYQNVQINVFNLTQNRAHNEVSYQYPTLVVIDENINAGDELKLTATSKTGAFNPVVKNVTVGNDTRCEVTFDLVGKGAITALFEMTDNPAVVAMLYGSNGELQKKMTYSEAKALFSGLEDGDYTLVTMGQSDMMNSILRLSNFEEIGLVEGKHYVKNIVTVESGELSEVRILEVPAFDESLFSYTTSNTWFSADKSSITTGNYLTLRSSIDFKKVYKNDISNVTLVIDLPETCGFVENSLIQGSGRLLPYTLDNNRLTIPLEDKYASQTRFCVIPTSAGVFNATASVVFEYNGKTITQPICSTVATIKELDFNVPATINSEKFRVNGVAPGYSNIDVYEDGTVIGSTRALANGSWSAECSVPEAYNFTTHTLYSIVTTKDNLQLKSGSVTVELDRSFATPRTVLMTFYNRWLQRNVDVTFDFTNLTIDNPAYMFYTETNISFIAEFSDNNPERLNNVTLWTLSSNNKETPITMSYDEASNRWIGSHVFDYYTAPVNLTLEYTYDGQKYYDRKQFSDFNNERESMLSDNIAEREDFIATYDADVSEDEVTTRLSELFSQDEPDEDEIRRLLNMSDESGSLTGNEMSDEEFDALSRKAEASWEAWEANVATQMRETVLTDYYADPEYDLLSDYEITSELEDGTKTVSQEKLASVDREELLANGYSPLSLDDGSEIFVLYGENLMEIIDCGQLMKYSIRVEKSASSAMSPLAKSPANAGSYLSYAYAAKNAIFSIYSLAKDYKRRWLVEVANKIHEASDGISKFYENFMNDFTQNIQSAYDRLSVLSDEEIETQQSLAEAGRERINGYNTKIDDKKIRISLYESERREVYSSTTLSEERKQALLNELDSKIRNEEDEIRSLKKKRNDEWKKVKKAEKNVKKIKKQSGLFRKTHTKIRETIDKFPKKLAKGLRLPKVLRLCGKVAGMLGVPLQCWSLFNDMIDMADDISQWLPLMDSIDAHHCYLKKDPKAVNLRESIYDSADWHATQNVGILKSEIVSIGFSVAGGVPGSPTWWAEMGFSVVAEWWKYFNDRSSLDERSRYWLDVSSLKCDDKDDDKDKKHDPKDHNYPFNPANPIHDPSGFVYEAVPANRVEGVQASIYYKETKEDMYGDPYEEVILWNAEEYAQRNPLFTDENGMYRWDVPQGLWQVKFEKDGYLTAYSDWLPVPPPQLEVNIPIVQNKQPEVTEARAYEEGIEVQFDKFMDPSTLNTSNIFVTANGEKLNGEVRLIDSAVADANADPEDTTAPQFASRVRFVPEQKLSTTTGEIRLTVSRNVLSYAGIPMTETFSQALDVEKEVQAIAADDVKVLYGGEKEVTVYALPFDAAVGRKLRVATSSDMIATVDVSEVTLDAEGKAVLKVRGALPGRAQLSFAIDDVTVTGDCAVDVVTEIITAEAPKSSRASGTAVYRGTKIELTTDSKNATIYFTTDGSCPCDENGTRRKYTVPIVISDDTHILAMTSVGNGDDDVSETVEFNYTLKRSDMDFQMPEGWTWMSHNFETALTPDAIATDANVSRILSQTQEVIRDPQLGMVGTLRELSASESYKVQTSSATSRVRLSDVAWNPATPIALTSGWNWLGYPLSQTMSVDEAFADTQAETLDIVVGQNGFAQFDGTNWVGTLETMSPGMGYMYQSQTGNNVVYNTSIVSTAASKYQPGIADNSPLVLDIHKYGKIMPVIATVSDLGRAGLTNSDCQVAAFCGSECRGIGRVVGGLVMMNVYGDTDDNITFTVTDLEGETAYANTASLRFGETVVGNVFSPYVIAINSGEDGISAVTYGGDITVSVEGDMLRIHGIDARDIDLVEVYDMSARKLIRETNISASGVRISNLSADVYVVVVCGNGEYTYHKIAVR